MRASKGLLRWKIAVPLLSTLLALIAYLWLLFDTHVRLILEGLATELNGAEVDIGELKTSISGGLVEVKQLAFTDPARPEYNRVELRLLRLELDSLALLRAKLIVREASVQDIQIQSRRKTPGKVLPPPPPAEKSDIKQQISQALEPVKQELLNNALALIKSKGLDNPLADINWQEMPSAKVLQDLQAKIEQKPVEWKALSERLPKPEQLEALKAKLKSLEAPLDPSQIPSRLSDLESLQSEAQAQVDLVKELGSSLQKDVKNLQQEIQNLQGFAKQDMALLQQRLKWPDLDFKGLAEELAGPEIKRYMGLLQFYYGKLQPYLESKQKPAPSKPLRLSGTNFSFPDTQGLPDFWLRKAQISSKATADGPLGNILGTLSDLSSNPSLVAQPTILALEGSFPSQGLEGLLVEASLDHRKQVAEDRLSLQLAAFPVQEKVLSESSDFVLGIHQAKGQMALDFVRRGDDLDVRIKSQFDQLSYRIESSSSQIKGFLDQALASILTLRLQATAKGNWQDLQWTIESNLADELKMALRTTLSKELAGVQDKLRQQVEMQLAEEQKKLEQKLAEQLAPFERQLQGSTAETSGLNSGIEGQKAKIQGLVDAEKAAAQAKLDAEKKRLEEQAQAERKKQEEKVKQELKNKLKLRP